METADVVFRNTRVLAGMATAITLGALLYIAAYPASYRSEALLLLRTDRAGAILNASVPGAAAPARITETDIRTEVELLQSRDMLERAVRGAGLISIESKNRGEMEEILARVSKALTVTAIAKADMIRLEYRSRSRSEGAHFLHELTRVHQDRYVTLRTGAKLKMFEEEADRLSAELKEKQKELSEYQRSSDVHSLSEQRSLLLGKMAATESQLRETELRKIEGQQRASRIGELMARLPQRLTTEVRRVPNQYSIERLRTLLVELENRHADADQIERTRKALNDAAAGHSVEESSNVNPARQTLESELARTQLDESAVGARMSKLGSLLAKYKKELDDLESSTAGYETLTRETRELEDRYQLNARKAEEVRIQTTLDDRRITNVVLAQEPQVPSHREAGFYWLAAAVWAAAMVLTFGGLVWAGRKRKTFFTPGSLEAFAGIPVLGTVPLDRRVIA